MKKFSWDLGYYCNFKCEYCFFTAAGWDYMMAMQGEPRSPEKMEEAWKKIHAAAGARASLREDESLLGSAAEGAAEARRGNAVSDRFCL